MNATPGACNVPSTAVSLTILYPCLGHLKVLDDLDASALGCEPTRLEPPARFKFLLTPNAIPRHESSALPFHMSHGPMRWHHLYMVVIWSCGCCDDIMLDCSHQLRQVSQLSPKLMLLRNDSKAGSRSTVFAVLQIHVVWTELTSNLMNEVGLLHCLHRSGSDRRRSPVDRRDCVLHASSIRARIQSPRPATRKKARVRSHDHNQSRCDV